MPNITSIFNRRHLAAIVASAALVYAAPSAAEPTHTTASISAPTPIKVVVVTMFEHGELTGDRAGEYQLWIERNKLTRLPFKMGAYDLHTDGNGVLVTCTGGGMTNATASIMALGTDPRFDLKDAYWVVTGIGGGDPLDVSLGSAVWANHVVDGDLLYEIDAREMPKDWHYGLIPLGAKEPNQAATGWTVDTIVYNLNRDLVQWAYQLTKDVPLTDTPQMQAFRELYKDMPNARKKPFVTIGDTIAASTYWHGTHLNAWANDWMQLHAGKTSNFMTTNMEDSGSITALKRLEKAGLVDSERVLVLRTVSNYSMAPVGKDTAWSTTAPYPDEGFPAIEAAYNLGNTVVKALIADWDTYATQLPRASTPQ